MTEILPMEETSLAFMMRSFNDFLEAAVAKSKRHKDEIMRAWLSKFGVTTEIHNTPMGCLSDGQKSRVAFA